MFVEIRGDRRMPVTDSEVIPHDFDHDNTAARVMCDTIGTIGQIFCVVTIYEICK